MAATATRPQLPDGMTPKDVAREFLACACSFWYFASRYVKVLDKQKNEYVLFDPYPEQVKVLDGMIADEWLWVYKQRQIGITTCMMIFYVWVLTFRPRKRVTVFSQDEGTGEGLLDIFNELEGQLPEYFRQARTKDNSRHVEFLNRSIIKIVLASPRSGRSIAGDYVLADEAAFIQYFQAALNAAQPTVLKSGGVMTVVSTSAGPANYFAAGYKWSKQGKTDFKPLFFGAFDHPGRDQEWWDREAATKGGNMILMYREFPRTEEEGFLASGDRVFPMFGPHHVVHKERPLQAKLYRAMDFGFSAGHQFVCVWMWHDPQAAPSFTWEPDCDVVWASPELVDLYAHGVDQMYAFVRDERTGKVKKVNDDICDAIAYGVSMFQFFGAVHVYKTLSVHNGNVQSWHIPEIFPQIMEMSGFLPVPNEKDRFYASPERERYAGTVCDRSGTATYPLLNKMAEGTSRDLIAAPYKNIQGVSPEDQKEARFAWINALVAGQTSPYGVTVYGSDAYNKANGIGSGVDSGQFNAVSILRSVQQKPNRRLG